MNYYSVVEISCIVIGLWLLTRKINHQTVELLNAYLKGLKIVMGKVLIEQDQLDQWTNEILALGTAVNNAATAESDQVRSVIEEFEKAIANQPRDADMTMFNTALDRLRETPNNIANIYVPIPTPPTPIPEEPQPPVPPTDTPVDEEPPIRQEVSTEEGGEESTVSDDDDDDDLPSLPPLDNQPMPTDDEAIETANEKERDREEDVLPPV